ncbi:MAG: hypothetical protein HRU19_31170 [Pseudobacteriovorax sp.]|nr:hypothetical protein [Pseudobacteriovorax sp.]
MRIFKQILNIFLVLALFACGSDENETSQLLDEDDEEEFSDHDPFTRINDPSAIPFPDYGCKRLFREANDRNRLYVAPLAPFNPDDPAIRVGPGKSHDIFSNIPENFRFKTIEGEKHAVGYYSAFAYGEDGVATDVLNNPGFHDMYYYMTHPLGVASVMGIRNQQPLTAPNGDLVFPQIPNTERGRAFLRDDEDAMPCQYHLLQNVRGKVVTESGVMKDPYYYYNDYGRYIEPERREYEGNQISAVPLAQIEGIDVLISTMRNAGTADDVSGFKSPFVDMGSIGFSPITVATSSQDFDAKWLMNNVNAAGQALGDQNDLYKIRHSINQTIKGNREHISTIQGEDDSEDIVRRLRQNIKNHNDVLVVMDMIERSITLLNRDIGFFGHWMPMGNFEREWNEHFFKIKTMMATCNLKFEGHIELDEDGAIVNPGDSPLGGNGDRVTCPRDQVSALTISMALAEMAGIAHSEGDVEAANELLEMSKEVLKMAADIALSLSPVGRAKDIVEALSGYSVIPPDFDELSYLERGLSLVGAFTVGGGTLKAAAKSLKRFEKYTPKSRILSKIDSEKKVSKVLISAEEVFEAAKKYGFRSDSEFADFAAKLKPSSNDSFKYVLYPRGPGASSGPVPTGYVKVERVMGDTEVKLWFDGGGTRIPPTVPDNGAPSIAVTLSGGPTTGGTGRNKIEFYVPESALMDAGVGRQIIQDIASTPIYNVKIFLP